MTDENIRQMPLFYGPAEHSLLYCTLSQILSLPQREPPHLELCWLSAIQQFHTVGRLLETPLPTSEVSKAREGDSAYFIILGALLAVVILSQISQRSLKLHLLLQNTEMEISDFISTMMCFRLFPGC